MHFPPRHNKITPYRTNLERITHEVYDAVRRSGGDAVAETLWLEMKAAGHSISQSTFNSRLKMLVTNGRVVRKTIAYREYRYTAAPEANEINGVV